MVLLNACASRVIYEINNGCHIFDKGYPSYKDSLETLVWFENHNDVWEYFCGVGK